MLGKNKNDLTWLKEIAEQDNNELVLKIDKVKYMGLKNTDDTTGITIIGLMPYTEVTNKLWDALTAPIIIIVLSIILFFIISTILVRRLLVPIKELVSVLRNVCKGDFSQKPKSHKHSSKEIDLISTSVSSMIDDMVAMLKNIKSTSKSVQESSELLYTITQNSSAVGEEVARAVQQIASGSTEQAASLNDGTNLSEELGREVEDAILVASEMINATKDVKDNTEIGRDCIAELKKTYSENNNANKVALEMSENLVSKSNEISNITNVIKTITEQTNLLALNASIEAARAGEFGKGFAVVAEEIRKLAEQSTKATEEISKVIEHIHSSILNLQQRINYSFELNEKTGKNIESTSEGFNNIEKSMNLLQQNVNKVTEALRNIQNHKDQVLLTLSNVSAVAQESAATTEEVSASTEEQAAGLQEIVIACEELNNLSSSLEEVLKKFIL
ncbi:MAG: methyl-accepting chemotaxis protein [Clostridiales bacterium]|nr:methyl-accepting chemotaxis protein [Clostridiales bacterium]